MVLRAISTIGLLLAFTNLVACQGIEKSDEKPKHSANLDVKNVDVTALYLNKEMIKLTQLQLEGDKTGNYLKYNEYRDKLNEEFADWQGVSVNWALQVNEVGNDPFGAFNASKIAIHPITEYKFKNKAVLTIKVWPPDSRMDGFPQQKMEIDEKWAKTLKRGDLIAVEAKIKSVRSANTPVIDLEVIKYSKYVPPQKTPVKK